MHNGFMKVENEAELLKDSASKAVINTNMSAREMYLLQRQAKARELESINKNTNDIALLKEEISDIKTMLKIILEKVN